MSYELPALPYAYSALEPFIDAKTMEIHHSKHHQAYITKVNAALEGSGLENMPIDELCANLDEIPENIRAAVRNNGGGHANHSLFWKILSTEDSSPSSSLLEAINNTFGDMNGFETEFSNAAATRFGSGWAWLIKNEDGSVAVTSTPNQDNPIMDGKTPILGLDVWEHAYYLNYQNRRPDYIAAFFKIINWSVVSSLYNG
jgi:Fe-Mn family superoxide dismutase